MNTIDRFKGRYYFLSNFYACRITQEGGLVYPSAEHAFQAQKSTDHKHRLAVAMAPTASEAKRRGRALPLRPDWEKISGVVMGWVVREKFTDPILAQKLLDTGDATLIEGNTWHDQIWGDCHCPAHKDTPGQNRLGELLMRVRKEVAERNKNL